MAGSSSDFDATVFRTAIQNVFTMGAPPNSSDQVKFYFPTQLVYNTAAVDGLGVPFDPVSTVTRNQPAPVSVPCGVEYKDGNNVQTVFGDTVPASIQVTVLDEDYAKIVGCAYIVMFGEKYKLVHTHPPEGLFDVGLYTLDFNAENAA